MSVEDLQEISNILALYCHLIDDKQWQRMGEVYTGEAAYGPDGGNLNQGLEAIKTYLSTSPQPQIHLTFNHQVELDEDGRRATGSGKWLSVLKDGTVLGGEYPGDVYAKTEVGWRILRRVYRVRVAPKVAE